MNGQGVHLSLQDIPKNITIIGPGALGCLLGAFLDRAGVSVALLDYKAERAKALDKNGIIVYDKDQAWKAAPRVTADPKRLGPQEAVIILVKAYQTASALEGISPLLCPDTLIISLQNGLGAEKLLTSLAPCAGVALGTTSQGATLIKEGVVRHAGKGDTTIGLITRGEKAADTLNRTVAVLNRAGWPCARVEDIYPVVWGKLLVNIGINALTALSGLKNGELLQHKEAMALQEALVKEGYQVAQKAGIHMDMDLDRFIEHVRHVCEATADNKSSMLQDRLKGRPTEIDYINGAVWRIANGLGLETPLNETITRLVRLCCSKAEN